MAATWQSVTLMSGQENAAGGSVQTPWVDFTGAYEAYIVARVDNQSPQATTGATVTCDISTAGGVFIGAGGIVQSGSGAGATFSWQFTGLEGAHARCNFSGNLGNPVNCFAVGQRMTGI